MNRLLSYSLHSLLVDLTDLSFSVDDVVGKLYGTNISLHWANLTWQEIKILRVVTQQAADYGLHIYLADQDDATVALQLLHAAQSSVEHLRELAASVDNISPHELDAFNSDLAESFETLRSCRIYISASLTQLQRENVQRTMMFLQDQSAMQYIRGDIEAMSGSRQLVCLQEDNTDTPCLMPHQSQPIMPHQSIVMRKHWKSSTSSNFDSRLVFLSCSASCQCKCHSERMRRLPAPLCRLFRCFFPFLSGEPRLSGYCDRLDCRVRYSGHNRVVVLHSSLFKRAIEILLSLNSSTLKIRFRALRTVSETSDIVRFSRMGDFQSFRKLILSEEATVFDATDDGWTNLMNAAFLGHLEIVEFLLLNGAPTEIAEVKLRKASHFAKFKAMMIGATDREKAIARLFPDQDFRYEFELSPILSSILHEYDETDTERPSLKTLLQFAASIPVQCTKQDWICWRWKYRNRSHLFQEMISFYENLSKSSISIQPTMLLIELPDAVQKWTPLQWAAFVDRKEEFVLLLDHGANPYNLTPSGRNLIHQAAESGTTEVLQYLLEKNYHKTGMDINLSDLWGETPLHLAASKQPALVDLLLKHGADPTVTQGDGLTPLHYPVIVANEKRLALVDIISIHARCPLNARENDGRTPAMYLVDNVASIDLLFSRGADPFLCDNFGNNIIHHACLKNSPDVIRITVQRLPDQAVELASQVNEEGDTPLFTAFRNHHSECTRILLTQLPISKFVDSKNSSTLHHAVMLGNEEILKISLSIPGPGLYFRNDDDETVFTLVGRLYPLNHPIRAIIKEASGLDEAAFEPLTRQRAPMWETYSTIR